MYKRQHLFDLLVWLFGSVTACEVHLRDERRIGGFLELEHARVRWFLSTDIADLPFVPEPGARTTFRSISVDGAEIEFSDGFVDLHTRVYEETLAGRGFGIDDGRPAIALSHRIRHTATAAPASPVHPMVEGRLR